MKQVKDLNRLLRWLQRTPQQIVYHRLKPPTRLVIASDSSFSAGDTAGLVMRGCVLMLVETDGSTPMGKVQVLDWFSRKQPHVCRSTFAAELHAALDALNQGLIVQALLSEIALGTRSARELLDIQSAGRCQPELHLCVDARSVYDAVCAEKVSVPADKHLFLHVAKMREFLDTKLLHKLWWVDTQDMAADGLTKGKIDRSAILALVHEGVWKQVGAQPIGWTKV